MGKRNRSNFRKQKEATSVRIVEPKEEQKHQQNNKEAGEHDVSSKKESMDREIKDGNRITRVSLERQA